MRTGATRTQRPALSLPREHGFWVMLVASLGGSLARARAVPLTLAAALGVAFVCILVAGAAHHYVRRASFAQLTGALFLACAGVPVEALGGVEPEAIAAGAAMKGLVFGSGVLLVRAALAAS